MQGLMVLPTLVDKIARVDAADAKFVKITGA